GVRLSGPCTSHPTVAILGARTSRCDISEARVSTARRFEVTSVGPRLCRLEVPTGLVDFAAPRPPPGPSARPCLSSTKPFSTEPSVRSLWRDGAFMADLWDATKKVASDVG